jgi:hypothetical protein
MAHTTFVSTVSQNSYRGDGLVTVLQTEGTPAEFLSTIPERGWEGNPTPGKSGKENDYYGIWA